SRVAHAWRRPGQAIWRRQQPDGAIGPHLPGLLHPRPGMQRPEGKRPVDDTWHQDGARSLGCSRPARPQARWCEGAALAIATLILWVLTASAGVSLLSSGRAARGASAGPGQPAEDAGPAQPANAADGRARTDAAAAGSAHTDAVAAGSAQTDAAAGGHERAAGHANRPAHPASPPVPSPPVPP